MKNFGTILATILIAFGLASAVPSDITTGKLLVAVPMGSEPTAKVNDTSVEVTPEVMRLAGQEVKVENGDVSPVTAQSQVATLSTMATNMNLAVVLLNDPTHPVSYTNSQIQSVVFGATNSVASYYAEQSGGQEHVTGNVFGPLSTSTDLSGCSISTILSAASSAVIAGGGSLNGVTNVVAITANLGCPWGGIAYVGSGGTHIQAPTASIISHELGHNLGNWHAGKYQGVGDTNLYDYGDNMDDMGSGTLRHFNAWHKANIGWISSSEIISQFSGTQTYTLTAEENPLTPGSTKMINLPGNYNIELRRPVGYDATNNNGPGVNGVWVHKAQFQSTSDTEIPFGEQAIVPGSPYVDNVHNFTVTNLADNGNTAQVQVCIGTCGAPPPTTTTTTAGPTTTTVPPTTTTTTTLPPGSFYGYDTGDDSDGVGGYASFKLGQTFTLPNSASISKTEILTFRKGNVGTLTCGIYITNTSGLPTGTVLKTGTVTGIGTVKTWNICNLSSPISLNGNTKYALVLSWTGGNGSNVIYWRNDSTNPTYIGGNTLHSRSSGAWDTTSPDLTRDYMFRLR